MANRLPIANIGMAVPNNELSQMKQQNAVMAHHMVYHLLKEQGIRINGHKTSTTSMRSLLARDKGLRVAISALETSCADMRHKYIHEIESLVNTLDVSDTQVYTNFMESCTKLMDDDIRWGRIAVLFFFSSVFAERLYKEGQSNKVESLVGWLTTFIDDSLSQWILEHGGWGGIEGAVNVGSSTQSKSKSSSSWLTLAAVGLGAVIVGALTMR